MTKETNGKMETPNVTTSPKVKFDDTDVTNTYANVFNVSISREEVVLVFGVNHAWERETSEVRFKLNTRIILNPFSAKRLALLLNSVVKQHEARFGAMDVGTIQTSTEKLSAK